MPRLIEDIVEVKLDDVEVLEPIDELEWTKDAEGVYHHDHFRIVPSGGKFALEIVEGKGKRSKAIQVCKGPLKVCKGFALDISEGRLVKLGAENYRSPVEIPPPVKTPEGIIKETDEALESVGISVSGPSPVKTPAVEIANDTFAGKFTNEIITPEIAKQMLETSFPVVTSVLGLSQAIALLSTGISVTDPCGNEIKPTDPDYAAALIPVATSVLSLSQAIALLSREYPISSLPPGSHFSQGGRFGTFIEMIGMDAKVEWEGKTTQWSGASPVKWAAERPGGETVKKVSPKAPLPTREEVKQKEEIKQANQAAQNVRAPSLRAESIF